MPFDDLVAFLEVVATGGFRAAAKKLGLAPSTVSETISRLERQVGTPLLIRNTRTTRPTEAGQALADRLTPLFAEARSAVETVTMSADMVRGPLRLNVPKAVMPDILPPIIDKFLNRHPDVSVEIFVEDSLVDAFALGCHAGIRYDDTLEQDMITVPIGPRRQCGALAAAPSYLAKKGLPDSPRDILEHDCILVRFSNGLVVPWEFERGEETIALAPKGRLILSAAAVEAAIGHAIAGQGLIQCFQNWLDPHFDSGALVPVLQEWWPEFDGPNLYFTSRVMPPPLRAFVDMLAEERQERKTREGH